MIPIQQSKIVTTEGQPVLLEYDSEADMLEIFFERRAASGAIELADPIILRFDRQREQALSLSILTFSRLIQPTQFGPVAFPLSGLEILPRPLKETVIKILLSTPVNHFLKVVGYYPTSNRLQQSPIPLSYMNKQSGLNKFATLAS
jgi:hypothetical protein